WCRDCERVVKNKATAHSRRNKRDDALLLSALQKQLSVAHDTLDGQRRLNHCLLNIIRDLAWCPACVTLSIRSQSGNDLQIEQHMHSQDIYPNSNAAFRGDHVPMPVVRSMPTLTGGAGSHSSHDRSREHVYVNGKRYGIDAWRGDSPGRHCASVNVKHIALDTCWASDCLYEAANFYWNFDSIGRCVAHVNTGKDFECAGKDLCDRVTKDCITAMNAILEFNAYAAFAMLKQAGFQTELVKESYQVVMALYRIFLTSKHFQQKGDTRVALTSGLYAKMDEVEVYLKDVSLPPAAYAQLARQIQGQWDSERRIAAEMTSMGVHDGDVAFMVFFVMMEEARRILHRRQEPRLAVILKQYRDALVSKWSYENYSRLHVPCSILLELT
ncbi:hypothetical protein AAVH_37959, partial [Aphelenchoides avenae]